MHPTADFIFTTVSPRPPQVAENFANRSKNERFSVKVPPPPNLMADPTPMYAHKPFVSPRKSWKTKVCFSHPRRQLCTYFSLIPDCPTSWPAARESGSTVSARGSAGGGSSGQGAERYRKKRPLGRTPEEFNSACQKKEECSRKL